MSHAVTCDNWLSPGNDNPKNAINGIKMLEWTGSNYTRVYKGVNSSFYSRLVAWEINLKSYSAGYGMPSTIYSFGHYGIYSCRHVTGTNEPSYHSWCRAFDLTRVRWESSSGVTSKMGQVPSQKPGPLKDGDHKSSSEKRRRRYLGVNAICCKYFKNTLNGWTPGHGNHIHVDDSMNVGVLDTSHKASVRFVQAACNDFNGADLNIDGDFGPLTTAAFTAANVAMCFSANVFTSSTAWKDWCSMIAKHGFKNKALGFYVYDPYSCPE